MLEEELASSAYESVEEQLRAAVAKGEVDQLRTLLRGLESPLELAPLLQLACARAETGAHRAELVQLLLEKGADPSAVGDGGSALWLAVAQGTNAIVSTLLQKATPKQRVAAARTLREKGAWALDARKAAGKGLEPEAKAWLEQIVDITIGMARSMCGDYAHLRPVQDGEGRVRKLVRGKAGWADADGGERCELEAEVLSAFPLKYRVEFEEQEESSEEEESDEEVVFQHREESAGEAAEDRTPPPREPAVQHFVARGGVAFRREAVADRNALRCLAYAMQAREAQEAQERAVASSGGVVAASEAAAEGEEGGELAADERGGAVAEGQHDGGSDNQQRKQARPTPTLTLTLTLTLILLTCRASPACAEILVRLHGLCMAWAGKGEAQQ